MTNRLELNWKLDGFVNEQRYYCSELPIDFNSPPPPKAVLGGSVRSYTDSNIYLDKTYNICVSSYKNGVEKFGDIIQCKALPQGFFAELRQIYAKKELIDINLIPLSSTSAIIGGALPDGWVLSGSKIEGEATTNANYSFTIAFTVGSSVIEKSYNVSIVGEMILDTQFDSNTDRIGGTWTLGSGNSLVDDITRKDNKKVLRLGDGIANATTVVTLNKTISRSVFNGDHTVCGWVRKKEYVGVTTKVCLYGSTSSDVNRNSYQFDSNTSAQWYRNGGDVNMDLTGAYTRESILVEEWIHFAQVKKSNRAYLFINGELVGDTAQTEQLSADRSFMLGGLRASGKMQYTAPLWIDGIKVYRGVGLWTESFDQMIEW